MRKLCLLLVSLIFVVSCTSSESDSSNVTGKVRVDGSSTVFPITEAVAEEFGKVEPRIRVNVGVSGTGGGFKKFTVGEIDINDASRPIKSKEVAKAQANGINYLEMPVAYDGISVVVNKENTWVDHLTSAELKRIWEPGSQVKTWKDVRAEWPDRKIRLYGPGTDSGTFDYFTEAINGKSHVSRSDFTKSEDDNVLVQGIAGDKDSLGYFGFAYYSENKDKLKIVPVSHNSGAPVEPTLVTINNGTYKPLSRPVFIYVNTDSGLRPEVRAFIQFYMKKAGELAQEVGYVSLPKKLYTDSLAKFEASVAARVKTN